MNIKAVCGIDWLSVSGHVGDFSAVNNISVCETKNKNDVFQKVKSITLAGEKVATLMYTPHSAILHPALCLLKFENKILYCSDANAIIQLTITELALSNVKISRVDIYTDFRYTLYCLEPETLIHHFIEDKILKIGRSKFALHGDKTLRNELSYLRFGGHSSMISVYMYNKTKELNEVKNKIYIRQLWSETGFETERDVWRIEFSINPQGECINDKIKNTIRGIKLADALRPEIICSIFSSCMQINFQFRKNTNTIRKDRMPHIEILPQNLLSHTIKFRKPKGIYHRHKAHDNRPLKQLRRHAFAQLRHVKRIPRNHL
jgi:hypothetical protein